MVVIPERREQERSWLRCSIPIPKDVGNHDQNDQQGDSWELSGPFVWRILVKKRSGSFGFLAAATGAFCDL